MSRSRFIFNEATGCKEAYDIRKFETNDIVVRLGVISPNRVHLNNYPIEKPITIFNASLHYDGKEEIMRLYARIVLGYYMYVSSIVKVDVPIEDVFNRNININHYIGEIVLYPTCKYDIWGVEDPRTYEFDEKLHMTYTGRTINYFNPAIRVNRTLPVTAIYDESFHTWRKKLVFTLSPEVFGEPISNKDAFLYKTVDDNLLLFHRPHLEDETYRLIISKIDDLKIFTENLELKKIEVDNGVEVIKVAPFEEKIGWATPPIVLNGNRVITLIHGTDNDVTAYRVFAAQLHMVKDEIVVEAVTPHYIMEPKTPYELVGDRPLVVFPCGAARIGKDEILITYGAADYMVGVGLISLSELLGELDKGRIY